MTRYTNDIISDRRNMEIPEKKRKLSTDEMIDRNQKIYDMASRGYTRKEIAREVGLSASRVSKILVDGNMAKRDSGYTRIEPCRASRLDDLVKLAMK